MRGDGLLASEAICQLSRVIDGRSRERPLHAVTWPCGRSRQVQKTTVRRHNGYLPNYPNHGDQLTGDWAPGRANARTAAINTPASCLEELNVYVFRATDI